MYHRTHTTYLQKELDFLKLLVSRFHEQEKVNGLELDVALLKTQEIYDQLLRIKLAPEIKTADSEKMPVKPEPAVSSTVVAVEHKPAEPERQPEPQIEPVKPGILAEKIGSHSDFHPINETLAQQKTGGDLSSKWQTAPLTSIETGIGLNDKFLFTRELFKGDSNLYNNTIRRLNTASSLEEALNFVRRQFDWDDKDETTLKFLHLVHRRHGGI